MSTLRITEMVVELLRRTGRPQNNLPRRTALALGLPVMVRLQSQHR